MSSSQVIRSIQYSCGTGTLARRAPQLQVRPGSNLKSLNRIPPKRGFCPAYYDADAFCPTSMFAMISQFSLRLWPQGSPMQRAYKCGDCGSPVGFRSRPRSFTEKYILPLFLLRPVRCGDCFRRSYRWVFEDVRERSDSGDTSRAA